MWTSSTRSVFRNAGPRVFCHRRGGIPGGAETSACADQSETFTAPQDPAPEGSSMSEADGVHERRMFRWPKEARELVREYKEQTSRSQERHEADRRTLVTK